VHPLRGAIFETWAVSEILKYYYHRGQRPSLFFYRDNKGNEVDLVIEQGDELIAVEMKSGQTPLTDSFAAVERFAGEITTGRKTGIPAMKKVVLYGGEHSQQRSQGRFLSWTDVASFPWEK
jgi:hypothetical protein